MTSFQNSDCGNIHFYVDINGSFANKERHYRLNEYFSSKKLYGKAPIFYKKSKMAGPPQLKETTAMEYVVLHKNKNEIVQALIKNPAFFAEFTANVNSCLNQSFIEACRLENELLVYYKQSSLPKSSVENALTKFLDSYYSSIKVETTFQAGYPCCEFTEVFANEFKRLLNVYFEVEVEDFFFREIIKDFKYIECQLNVFNAVEVTELLCYFCHEIPLRENLYTHNVREIVQLRPEQYSFFILDFHCLRIVELFKASTAQHEVKIDHEAHSIEFSGPIVDVAYFQAYVTFFSQHLIHSHVLYNRTVLKTAEIKKFLPHIFKYKLKHSDIHANVEMNGKKITLSSTDKTALQKAVTELNTLFDSQEYDECTLDDTIYESYFNEFKEAIAEKFPLVFVQFDENHDVCLVAVVGPKEEFNEFMRWLVKELKLFTLDGYLIVQFVNKVKFNTLLTQVKGLSVKVIGEENVVKLFMLQFEMYRLLEQTKQLQQPHYTKGNACKALSQFDIPEIEVLFISEPMFFDYFKQKIFQKCSDCVAFELCCSSNQLVFYYKTGASDMAIVEEIRALLQDETSADTYCFSQTCQQITMNDAAILRKFIERLNDYVMSKEIELGHRLAVRVGMLASNEFNIMGLKSHNTLAREDIIFKNVKRVKINLDLLPVLYTDIMTQLIERFSDHNFDNDDDVILEIEDDCVYVTGSFYFYVFFCVYFEKILAAYPKVPKAAYRFSLDAFGPVFRRSEKLFGELCKELNGVYAGTKCELSVYSDCATVRPPLNILANPLGFDIEETCRVIFEKFISSRLREFEAPFYLKGNDILGKTFEEMLSTQVRHLAKQPHKPLLVYVKRHETKAGIMLICGVKEDAEYAFAALITETQRYKIGSKQPVSEYIGTLLANCVRQSVGKLSFSYDEPSNQYHFKGPSIGVTLLEMLIEIDMHGLFPRIDITDVALMCTRNQLLKAFKEDFKSAHGFEVSVNLGQGHALFNRKVTSELSTYETVLKNHVFQLYKKHQNLHACTFSLPLSYSPELKSEFLNKCFVYCVDIEMTDTGGRFVYSRQENEDTDDDDNLYTISCSKKFGRFQLTSLSRLEGFMREVNKLDEQLVETNTGNIHVGLLHSNFNVMASKYDSLYILLLIENLARKVNVAVYRLKEDVYNELVYKHLAKFTQQQENELVKVCFEHQYGHMLVYTISSETLREVQLEIKAHISKFERYCDVN